jgi:ribonuclease P protein component
MRRSEDFRRTTRNGVRVARPTLVVHAGTAAHPEDRQVGFVVGKSVGNAVVRNRVRRRLRHLAATELMRTPPGVCLVLRALPRAASEPAEVPTDLAKAWPKALARLAGAR